MEYWDPHWVLRTPASPGIGHPRQPPSPSQLDRTAPAAAGRCGFESRLGAMKPSQMKRWWHVWAKALGEKASPSKKEADQIALIRSVIFLTYFLTNCFIVAGVLRHWNS